MFPLSRFQALQSGNAALNAIHEEMSVEDVQNILDETNEAIEVGLLCMVFGLLQDVLEQSRLVFHNTRWSGCAEAHCLSIC